ncbi:hypothetical protein [Vibrio phage phiKT1028]|nr:hypothetical protein [Vibrio phage phiKT1028]
MPLMVLGKTGCMFEAVADLGGGYWVTNLMYGSPVWKDRLPLIFTNEEGKEEQTKVVWGGIVTEDTGANWNTTELDDILWTVGVKELRVGVYKTRYGLKVVCKLPIISYYGMCENGRIMFISTNKDSVEIGMLEGGSWSVDPDTTLSDAASIVGIDCPVETFSWGMLQKHKPNTPKIVSVYKSETGKSLLTSMDYKQKDIDNWMALFDKALEKHL